MKQYISPIITISDTDIQSAFLIGSDPTLNPSEESNDMESKEIIDDDFGEYLW